MIATLTLRTERGEEMISGPILTDEGPRLLDALRDAIERYRRFEADSGRADLQPEAGEGGGMSDPTDSSKAAWEWQTKRILELERVAQMAVIYVRDSYEPEPKHDRARFMALKYALIAAGYTPDWIEDNDRGL